MNEDTSTVSVQRDLLEQALDAAAAVGMQDVADELDRILTPTNTQLHRDRIDYPPCDYCGTPLGYHPWHGSGLLNGVENRHIHACDECRRKLPQHPGHEAKPWLDVTMADLEGARLQRDHQRHRADELQVEVDRLREANLHHRNLEIEAADAIAKLRAELDAIEAAAWLGLHGLYRTRNEAELAGEQQLLSITTSEVRRHAWRYLVITRQLGMGFKRPNGNVTTNPGQTDSAIDAYCAEIKEQSND